MKRYLYGFLVTFFCVAIKSYGQSLTFSTPDDPIYYHIFFTTDGGMSMHEIGTPFAIRGKGVRKGEVIDAPMMNYDVAVIIADTFRIKHPSYWRCSSMDLFKKK